MMKHILIELAVFAVLLIIAWAGFQITPKGFEQKSFTETIPEGYTKPQSNIPVVMRYYSKVFKKGAYETETSLVAGIARFNMKGIRMMGRFITFYKADEGFYRYIEVTWFGIPVITGYDLYTKDRTEFCMAGSVETGERIEQGQNLALWAESVWSPAMLVLSDDIQWEAHDDRTIAMHIPYRDTGDTLFFSFGEDGYISGIEAMRYKGNSLEKARWEIECSEWGTFDGMTIPIRSSVKWGDEDEPWAHWRIDSVAYNIPISEGFKDEMVLYGHTGDE